MSKLAVFLIVFWLPWPGAGWAPGTAQAADCSSWSSTACWAHLLQDLINDAPDVAAAIKQLSDRALAGVSQASQSLGAVADHADAVLKQVYGKLAEHHDQICADDDLFFLESIAVVSAAIVAVELAATGGASAGAGAVALKGVLIAQSPKLMSKLHERLCGSPFTKVEPGLVTQIETAVDKALSGK